MEEKDSETVLPVLPAALPTVIDEQFSLSELLSVWSASLPEKYLWSIIAQGAIGLKKRLNQPNVKLANLRITPDYLSLCSDGGVRILSERRGGNDDVECYMPSYMPPDNGSIDEYDKALSYMLAVTVYHAADYELDDDEEPILSPRLEILFQDMTEEEPATRLSLDGVIKVAELHKRNLEPSTYESICIELVAEVYQMKRIIMNVNDEEKKKISEKQKMAMWKKLSTELNNGVKLRKPSQTNRPMKPVVKHHTHLAAEILEEICSRPPLRKMSSRQLPPPLPKIYSPRELLMNDLTQTHNLNPVKINERNPGSPNFLPDCLSDDPSLAGSVRSHKKRLTATGIVLDLLQDSTNDLSRGREDDDEMTPRARPANLLLSKAIRSSRSIDEVFNSPRRTRRDTFRERGTRAMITEEATSAGRSATNISSMSSSRQSQLLLRSSSRSINLSSRSINLSSRSINLSTTTDQSSYKSLGSSILSLEPSQTASCNSVDQLSSDSTEVLPVSMVFRRFSSIDYGVGSLRLTEGTERGYTVQPRQRMTLTLEAITLESGITTPLKEAQQITQLHRNMRMAQEDKLNPKMAKDVIARRVCYVCHTKLGWFFTKGTTCYLCQSYSCSKCIEKCSVGDTTHIICITCVHKLQDRGANFPDAGNLSRARRKPNSWF